MPESTTIDGRWQMRGRTAADWATINEVLLDRELGIETDTKKRKVGDGTTPWNSLAYDVDPATTAAVNAAAAAAASSASSAAASAAAAGTPFSIATVDGTFTGQTTTAAGISLPSGATNPVAVTLISTGLLAAGSGAYGFLGSTYGLLVRAPGGGYTFTPAVAPGSTVTVTSGTAFRMDAAFAKLSQLLMGAYTVTDEPFDDLGYARLWLGSTGRMFGGFNNDGAPFFNKVGKFLLDAASAALVLSNPTIAAAFLSLATPSGHILTEELGYADQYDRVWRYSDLRLALALLRTGQVYAPKLRVDQLDVGTATGGLSPRTAVSSAAGLFQVEDISGLPQIIRYSGGNRTQLTGVNSGVGSQNYAPSLTSETPQRVLFTSNRRSTSAPGYFVTDLAGAEAYPAVPDAEIAVWGDSMGQDQNAAIIQAGLAAAGATNPTRTVLNKAFSGNSSPVVAVRMGAIPWTVTVAGNTIPASGSVVLTNHRTPLLSAFCAAYPGASPDPDFTTYGSWPSAGAQVVSCTIGGVAGTVTESGGVYSFNRTTAGSSVAVPSTVNVIVTQSGSDSLVSLNSDTAILWPFGPHINQAITAGSVDQTTTGVPQLEMDIVRAMVAKLGAVDKRFILLYHARNSYPSSGNTNNQRDYTAAQANATAYATNYPNNYYNYVPAFCNGDGSIPSFKSWLQTNHPTRFADASWGWAAPLITNPDSGDTITLTEPAAAATLTLTGNGTSGVTSTNSVNAVVAGATALNKVNLRVGITASGGVATALWVREGGQGMAPGDTFTIPIGAAGNSTAITGTIATTRSETMGIVRDAAGAIVVASSYSQWEMDNGFIPRCARRDVVHMNTSFVSGSLTGTGAQYLALLLGQQIALRNW